MALITKGRTSTPSVFVYQGTHTQLYLSDLQTMGEAGYVQDIFVFCGAYSATGTFYFGLYDPSNHLLPGNGTSGGVVTAAATYGVGYGWNSGTFSSFPLLQNSQQWHITVSCNQGLQWKSDSGTGGHYYTTDQTIPQQSFSGWTQDTYGNPNTPQGYIRYWQVCSISSITGTPVAPGQSFTINGTSFGATINSIDVNGTAVTTFTVNSDSQITATVPVGATTGPVHVNTNVGNATSPTNLTVSSAYINTGTPASPVWTNAAGVFVNTGTPASPIWTQASGVLINTGTPASPIWTPGG